MYSNIKNKNKTIKPIKCKIKPTKCAGRSNGKGTIKGANLWYHHQLKLFPIKWMLTTKNYRVFSTK